MKKTSQKNISIAEILTLSRKLHAKHKDDWPALEPQNARDEFLWLITELGEVLDIIKKDGEEHSRSRAMFSIGLPPSGARHFMPRCHPSGKTTVFPTPFPLYRNFNKSDTKSDNERQKDKKKND